MFQAVDDKILKTTTVKSLLTTNAELYNSNSSLLRSSFGPKGIKLTYWLILSDSYSSHFFFLLTAEEISLF